MNVIFSVKSNFVKNMYSYLSVVSADGILLCMNEHVWDTVMQSARADLRNMRGSSLCVPLLTPG